VTVKNATPRPGLAARTTTALRRLGFKAANAGNATPAATTTLAHAPGSANAAGVVAQVLKAVRGVARHPQPGLTRTSVVLALGNDFKGVAPRIKGQVAPTRPAKPTAATRALPPWDPRPC
jgi:hypothetical protein